MNSVMITGRLGQDVQTRTTTTSEVANFSIAVSERWKDKSGIKQERTTWVPISAWGNLATICANNIRKGSKVLVQGRLEQNEYDAKDGTKVKEFRVIANDVEFLENWGTKSDAPPQTASDDMP